MAALDPMPNTNDASPTSEISATFDSDIDPATASPHVFAVHAQQTGQILESMEVRGDTIRLAPTAPLHPGETVQVTVSGGIENVQGEPAASHVWQFRTTAEGGTGLFDDTGQRLGNARSQAVALGDLDGDGDLDALVANRRSRDRDSSNTVWLNDGQGTYSDSGQQLGELNSSSVALGDIDGDGDLDAFVGNSSDVFGDDTFEPLPNTVWLNDGRGRFSKHGENLEGLGTGAVALGDLDADGDLDVFAANFRVVGCCDWFGYEGPNKVWLNDGRGTFTDSGQSLGLSGSRSVSLADVDGDGDLDAFVANGLYDGEPNRVWLNDGRGTFSDNGQRLGDSLSQAVSLGDLDGDGDVDAYVANGEDEAEADTVWLNNGNGHFEVSRHSLPPSVSSAVSLGDVDGDGDLDAVVTGGTFREPASNPSTMERRTRQIQ